jgi:hypothetical protein
MKETNTVLDGVVTCVVAQTPVCTVVLNPSKFFKIIQRIRRRKKMKQVAPIHR